MWFFFLLTKIKKRSFESSILDAELRVNKSWQRKRGEREVGGGGADAGGSRVGGGGVLPWSKVKLVMSAMTHSSQHALLTSRIPCSSPPSPALSLLSLLLVKHRTSCSLSRSRLSSVYALVSVFMMIICLLLLLGGILIMQVLFLWTVNIMVTRIFLFLGVLFGMNFL